jgi:uncharacterized SAM-binding protein YcdF (DUF218 family)
VRLLWDLFQPSNALFILLVLGGLCRLAGRRRVGAWLLGISTAGLAAIVLLPLSSLLASPLETRFPQPRLPAHVDGIITLGGVISSQGTERWHQPQLNEHAERLTEAIALARRHPEATLLVSGGHWDPDDRRGEAEIARDLLVQLGQPLDRALFENNSRTTWENAVFSHDLARPRPGQAWVLVTSALHMPRAVGVFRAVGWDVIPYPVDYMPRPSWAGVGYRLDAFDAVVREWAALAMYHARGRTQTLLPR